MIGNKSALSKKETVYRGDCSRVAKSDPDHACRFV